MPGNAKNASNAFQNNRLTMRAAYSFLVESFFRRATACRSTYSI